MKVTKVTKVYVAGGWKFRHELKKISQTLNSINGIEVISFRENRMNSPPHLASDAKFDLEEISSADIVLAIMTDPEYVYRGTFTKIGYAIGIGKPVIIWCDGSVRFISTTLDADTNELIKTYDYTHYCMTNVFYHHPVIMHAATFDEVIAKLNTV